MNTIKVQNTTKRGMQMARTAAVVFAFLKPINIDTSFKTSTKIITPVATAAPVKMSGSQIADEVVDVRLLVLLEVNVEINDTTLIIALVIQTIFPFERAGSHRAS